MQTLLTSSLFTNPANITLYARTVTGGGYATFYKYDGTPYQVPTGKKFVTKCVDLTKDACTLTDTVVLNSGDSNVGQESNSDMTNSQPAFALAHNSTASFNAEGHTEFPCFAVFPEGKFIGISCQHSGAGANDSWVLIGSEEAA